MEAARPLPRCDVARLAVGAWVAAVAGIAIHGYFFPATHTLYPVYARAARNWLTRTDLYDGSIWLGIEYRYSPLFATLLTPLTLLPDQLANVVWKLLGCVAFALGLRAWTRNVLPAGLSRVESAWLFLLAIPASAVSMYSGQANLIMMAALLFGFSAAAQDRWGRAALWSAAAVLVKGFPLAYVLIVAALFPKRFAPRSGVAIAGGMLLPFATASTGYAARQTVSWMALLVERADVRATRYVSIDQMWRLCGVHVSPAASNALAVAAGLAAFGLCWRAAEHLDRRALLARVFSLTSVWLLLFVPVIEPATLIVIAPVIAWSMLLAFGRPAPWVWRVLLLLSFLLLGPLATDIFGSAIRRFTVEHGGIPLGGLIYLACLLRELRSGRTDDRSVPATDHD